MPDGRSWVFERMNDALEILAIFADMFLFNISWKAENDDSWWDYSGFGIAVIVKYWILSFDSKGQKLKINKISIHV